MNPRELAEAAWIMGFGELTPTAMNLMEPRFPLGRTYATSAVTAWAEQHGVDLTRYLRRHHCGDWGDLDADDKLANEEALREGARILSAYLTAPQKIFVITEADRSMTTVLFAQEY